jgi:hypothetical protein
VNACQVKNRAANRLAMDKLSVVERFKLLFRATALQKTQTGYEPAGPCNVLVECGPKEKGGAR